MNTYIAMRNEKKYPCWAIVQRKKEDVEVYAEWVESEWRQTANCTMCKLHNGAIFGIGKWAPPPQRLISARIKFFTKDHRCYIFLESW